MDTSIPHTNQPHIKYSGQSIPSPTNSKTELHTDTKTLGGNSFLGFPPKPPSVTIIDYLYSLLYGRGRCVKYRKCLFFKKYNHPCTEGYGYYLSGEKCQRY